MGAKATELGLCDNKTIHFVSDYLCGLKFCFDLQTLEYT